jgi:hypothetical protein
VDWNAYIDSVELAECHGEGGHNEGRQAGITTAAESKAGITTAAERRMLRQKLLLCCLQPRTRKDPAGEDGEQDNRMHRLKQD